MAKGENYENKKKYGMKRFRNMSSFRYSIQKKVIDNSITSSIYSLAGTWTKTLINGVQRGSDESNVLGREGLMHSVFIRGVVQAGANMTGEGLIRTAIIYDRQPNAATFTTLDCFKEDSIRTITNLDNRKRFFIIHDEVVKLSAAAIGDGNSIQSIYAYHKLNKMFELNGTNGGTIADFTKGALFLCTCTSGDFAVAAPAVELYARVRFTDNNDYIKNVSIVNTAQAQTGKRMYFTPTGRTWGNYVKNNLAYTASRF